jgi:hypothetical protein
MLDDTATFAVSGLCVAIACTVSFYQVRFFTLFNRYSSTLGGKFARSSPITATMRVYEVLVTPTRGWFECLLSCQGGAVLQPYCAPAHKRQIHIRYRYRYTYTDTDTHKIDQSAICSSTIITCRKLWDDVRLTESLRSMKRLGVWQELELVGLCVYANETYCVIIHTNEMLLKLKVLFFRYCPQIYTHLSHYTHPTFQVRWVPWCVSFWYPCLEKAWRVVQTI